MWPYYLNHALILHTLNTMSLLSKQHNKIIVKVGSAVLTDDQGRVKKKILDNIARDIASLKDRKIILVSSGAIAIGKRLLNIEKINSIEESQALAAVGQLELIKAWKTAFKPYSLDVGQVLLTPKEIQTNKDAKNALKTINQLHDFKVLPIVNENDTTATDEIQFGDNDLLAAKLAKIFKADLLIMLSAVEGLYESFDDAEKKLKLVRRVSRITKDIHAMAGKASKSGKGGMLSKIDAAKIMLSMNSDMVISKGDAINPLTRLKKSSSSTWFKK
jgi:glutamate 5-kinase